MDQVELRAVGAGSNRGFPPLKVRIRHETFSKQSERDRRVFVALRLAHRFELGLPSGTMSQNFVSSLQPNAHADCATDLVKNDFVAVHCLAMRARDVRWSKLSAQTLTARDVEIF